MKDKKQKIKFKKENNNNQAVNYKKPQSQFKLILEDQEISLNKIIIGFIGLTKQNQELVKLNKQLIQQLETLVEKLNQIKQERRKKEMRKQTYANPKRLPKRASIIVEIYKKLIKEPYAYVFRSKATHQ